jgi:hypothetical protein
MYWRGLTHDLSKYSLVELIGYMRRFGGGILVGRDNTGAYDPTINADSRWERAWRHHFQHNDHHWQYWCTPTQNHTFKMASMSDKAIKEMVCDWAGAGRAQKSALTVQEWYHANKFKMCLDQWTRYAVEREIGYTVEAFREE